MRFLHHLGTALGVWLLCAAMSIVWLQTLLFNTAPAHAAGGSPRNGDFGPSMEQCGKSKVQAEKIEYCSIVIARSSDRKILERAFNRRGLAYMDLQRFAEAAKDFTEVIKVNPRIAGYFDNRQNAYKAMGRLSDALNDANKAIELAPAYAFVFRGRANVYADMGRYDLALHDYNLAITLEPKDAGLFVDRGKVHVKAQQIDKAIADFTQAFDSDRNMTVALRERGFAYRLLGNFDAARADLTLFLRLQPNDEEVVSALRDMAPQPVRLAVTKSDESSPLRVPSGSVLGQSEAQRVSERRIALVVGNSAYRNVPRLTNPANDAKLIAETLRSLGFELVGGSAQIDLDKPNFEGAVKRFGLLLQGADVGLFYYAGHGVQVHGENYLVPVSANPEREADVDFEMLGTTLVMRQMEGAHTRLNLILLDACRNNPFGTRASRATSRGLAQMEAPEGTLISFATQPGNVASDGEDGDSPYTKALAQTIQRPGLGLFDVFNQVGLEVKKQTGGSQQPWVSSSPIGGSFFFSRPPEAQPAALAAAPAHAEQPNEAQQVWGTIQNTTSVAVLERFIQQFPASFYSDIARTRLDELKKSQVTAPSTPPSSATKSAPPGSAGAAPPRECSGRVGYVTGLDPHGDNNLSVREGPHTPKGPGHEIDELFTGDLVCIVGSDGTWFRVQYIRSGTAKTGWVHSHYIRLAGHAGAMSCAELNRPHDPQPVRQWLRGYLSSAGYDGDYQAAATEIGVLCQASPQWTLEMSARHWVEDLWGKRSGLENH